MAIRRSAGSIDSAPGRRRKAFLLHPTLSVVPFSDVPSFVYTPGKFAPTKMSFSFGFDAVPTPAPSELVSEATPSAPQAAEHQPSEARLEAEQWPVEEVVVETGAVRHTLRKPVQPEALLPELIGDGEKVADLDSSDLVKGVYEGGFKLWECARDMMEVLEELRLQGALEVRRSQSQAPAAALGSGC